MEFRVYRSANARSMRFEFWAVALAVRAAAGKLRFQSVASQLYTQIIKFACQYRESLNGVL